MRLPRGPNLEPRLTSISPMRRACSGMLLLYRLFAAVLLIYVGTVFLVSCLHGLSSLGLA